MTRTQILLLLRLYWVSALGCNACDYDTSKGPKKAACQAMATVFHTAAACRCVGTLRKRPHSHGRTRQNQPSQPVARCQQVVWHDLNGVDIRWCGWIGPKSLPRKQTLDARRLGTTCCCNAESCFCLQARCRLCVSTFRNAAPTFSIPSSSFARMTESCLLFTYEQAMSSGKRVCGTVRLLRERILVGGVHTKAGNVRRCECVPRVDHLLFSA